MSPTLVPGAATPDRAGRDAAPVLSVERGGRVVGLDRKKGASPVRRARARSLYRRLSPSADAPARRRGAEIITLISPMPRCTVPTKLAGGRIFRLASSGNGGALLGRQINACSCNCSNRSTEQSPSSPTVAARGLVEFETTWSPGRVGGSGKNGKRGTNSGDFRTFNLGATLAVVQAGGGRHSRMTTRLCAFSPGHIPGPPSSVCSDSGKTGEGYHGDPPSALGEQMMRGAREKQPVMNTARPPGGGLGRQQTRSVAHNVRPMKTLRRVPRSVTGAPREIC